ncbi:DDB1- and CUL4-associated factor 11 isoform X2 [Aplysia californica]|uniref:DDB1- and CUL4-associated factor 11 isoform X2 n=1 Tax=Aplysia californica TaxID=6500 RepID=A0ABM1A0X1_APLCA|nr:DDB1- and CUL4-associated factor 11 isoform X2 [Aplysia californica]
MGLSHSRGHRRMSGSDQEQEESGNQRYNLRSNARSGGDDDEADLSSIVAYLIRSGQIRFISRDTGDSDSDNSSDCEFVAPSRAPIPDLNPDVKNLKKSDIFTAVMRSSGRWSDKRWLTMMKPTVPNMLVKRELGLNRQQQFSHGDQCLLNSKYLPNKMEKICSYHHKAFCGSYSADGNVFLSACQDQHLRVYDTSDDEFKVIKCIRARDVGWSILDTAFSPDGRYAAYSSWSDCIHISNIYGDHDIHEALHLNPGDHSFCIFSLMFSYDNKEILGGANDGNIYVYDREANKRTLKIDAHDDDVNTVRFADFSSQILYSGGDDGLCKVWDRRTLREERPIPVGVLAGHSDGITYIDSKGDARFFISNSKDQTLKLWDVRCFSDQTGVEETKKVVSSQRWDYRWQQVPRRMARKKELKGDTSVMTYRGHCVLHTLIRCKFSPETSTGQRYVYSGCATGSVVVYDLLTGQVACRLEGHNSCTRDVSWHPYKNTIISTSWDGTLGRWYYHDHAARGTDPDEDCVPKILFRAVEMPPCVVFRH